MSEPTTIAAAEAIAPTIKRISAKDFLATKPKVLKEKEVTVALNDDTELLVVVRQLTRPQANVLNRKVINTMPEQPTVEHEYKTMHTDPATGNPRRPGKYQEPNPEDPRYKQELEVWFNESCVWLGIIAAAEDFGVTPDNLESKFEEISELLPDPSLLRLALEAARVNQGLNLAEQILFQAHENESLLEHLRELEMLEAEVAELENK